jgi:hypothetical protein
MGSEELPRIIIWEIVAPERMDFFLNIPKVDQYSASVKRCR